MIWEMLLWKMLLHWWLRVNQTAVTLASVSWRCGPKRWQVLTNIRKAALAHATICRCGREVPWLGDAALALATIIQQLRLRRGAGPLMTKILLLHQTLPQDILLQCSGHLTFSAGCCQNVHGLLAVFKVGFGFCRCALALYLGHEIPHLLAVFQMLDSLGDLAHGTGFGENLDGLLAVLQSLLSCLLQANPDAAADAHAGGCQRIDGLRLPS